MQRRKFLGTIPLGVGGAMVLGSGAADARGTLTASPSIWVNVKAFGATGNGTTDDTGAVLAAIASISQNNTPYRGGILYFPAGRYKCTSTLALIAYNVPPDVVHNVIVRGDGPLCTVLDFSSASAGTNGLTFNYGAQFGVEDIEINGAPGDGIVVGLGLAVGPQSPSCSHFAIRNVRVQLCKGNGISLTNAFMGTLADCWVFGCNGIGFLFNGFHTSIDARRCYSSGNAGIGWSLNGMTYSSFTACGSDGNVWGYAMTNMVGVAFSACGAESNQREGWLLMTSSSTVAGLPANVTDIHGVTFTSCSSYLNSQSGTNAFGAHMAASTSNGRPIQFKMSGNTSVCNTGSTVSMVLNGSAGAITVYDELSYFGGIWVISGTVTRKTL